LKDGENFGDLATDGLTINTRQIRISTLPQYEREVVFSTRVQYRAVVNSVLVTTPTVEKTGNFLIRRLFITYSYIITQVMYLSEQIGLNSRSYPKCLTVKNFEHV